MHGDHDQQPESPGTGGNGPTRTRLVTSPLYSAAASTAHGVELPRSREQVLLHQAVVETPPGKNFFPFPSCRVVLPLSPDLLKTGGMDPITPLAQHREHVGRTRPTARGNASCARCSDAKGERWQPPGNG